MDNGLAAAAQPIQPAVAQAAQTLQSVSRAPDTMLAHVTPDEAKFIDYLQGGRKTNPVTGLPEYGLFGDILKAVARVGGAIGGFMVGGPLGAAAGSGAATKLTGGKWNDALKAAALSGVGAELGQGLSGAGWSPIGAAHGAAAGAGAGSTVGEATKLGGMSLAPEAGSAAARMGITPGVAAYTAPAQALPAMAPALGAPSTLSNLISTAKSWPGIAAGAGALLGSPLNRISAPAMPGAKPDIIHLGNITPFHRNQMPYMGDLTKYAETGGEHQFFDDVNPQVQYYAGGGAIMGPQGPVLGPRALRDPGQPTLPQPGMSANPLGGIGGIGSHVRRLQQAALLGYQGVNMAHGGALYGEGGGKDDEIKAQLSPGEHVTDAQTISYMGDGNNDAGHRVMEEIKKEVRARAGQKNPSKPTSPVGLMVARAKRRAGVK